MNRGLGVRAGGLAFALGVALLTSAHVGSSNAYFEGLAGPYPVRVIVRTPGVIPGLAQISVRVLDGPLPTTVTVQPLRWDVGLEGAPPPDAAAAVPGEEGLYAAELWLMTTGSYSVRVGVAGGQGRGTAFVPVNAVAERRLAMSPLMAVPLVGAALFLFLGAITIFGAAVRESVVEPGDEPSPKRRRRAKLAMAIGGIALGAILWGGWTWWDAVDAAYRGRIFRPLATTSYVSRGEAGPFLTLRIDDPTWGARQWTPLMADHGKLMHMFLVHDDDLSQFAHLHPAPVDSSSFVAALPPLRQGSYRLYADIVHESGFAQTLLDTLQVGTATTADQVEGPVADPDDSWAELPSAGGATASEFVLPSGRRVSWEAGTEPRVDQELSLGFRVREADGTASVLEPYTGMLSHAVVTRPDGSLFMHIHPTGSINMAAQARFGQAEGQSAASDVLPAVGNGPSPGSFRFPFVFPSSGEYRIFVQVKVDGVVETAAFDVVVT